MVINRNEGMSASPSVRKRRKLGLCFFHARFTSVFFYYCRFLLFKLFTPCHIKRGCCARGTAAVTRWTRGDVPGGNHLLLLPTVIKKALLNKKIFASNRVPPSRLFFLVAAFLGRGQEQKEGEEGAEDEAREGPHEPEVISVCCRVCN